MALFRLDPIAIGFALCILLRGISPNGWLDRLLQYRKIWPWLLFAAIGAGAFLLTELTVANTWKMSRSLYPLGAAAFGAAAIALAYSLRGAFVRRSAWSKFFALLAAVSYFDLFISSDTSDGPQTALVAA